MGVTVSPTAIRVNNTAAVMVTATLPPFAQPGTRIDVTAAAIGDCANLQGGLLLLTSLRGADGQVYAVAQGPVVINGFAAGRRRRLQHDRESSDRGTHSERRHCRARRALGRRRHTVQLQLRQADFTTAARDSRSGEPEIRDGRSARGPRRKFRAGQRGRCRRSIATAWNSWPSWRG